MSYAGNGHHPNGHARGIRIASEPPPPAFDRMPPASIEAETQVIGAMLIDNGVIDEVAAIVRPSDFFRAAHEILVRAIFEIRDSGRPADAVTIAERLKASGEYGRIGGDDALVAILSATPHAANATYHAAIVFEKATKRRIIAQAQESIAECYQDGETAAVLLDRFEGRAFAIAEGLSSGETRPVSEAILGAMERFEARRGGEFSGLPTGLTSLDDITDGFQPESLIVVGARPSMGKTAAALNFAEAACLEAGSGVLFVSLEMGKVELGERLLVARARVDGHKLRTGAPLTDAELSRLGRAYDEYKAARLWIDDTPGRSIAQIAANARRHKARHDIGLVVVDYLQLIDSGETDDRRHEFIAKVSRRLKMLARELKIPVVALSQLNRSAEGRETHRPRLADLRESGAIEQDADIVILLHRPEYYDPNDQPGIAEVIVAKNRNGKTDTIKAVYHKAYTRFEDFAPYEAPAEGHHSGDEPF
jgi:replicative DNA helicase